MDRLGLAVLKPGKNSQRLFQLAAIGFRPLGSQLPADGDGFLDCGQRVLRTAQAGQDETQAVQRRGQARPERVPAGRGQIPVGFGGLFDRGQRVVQSAQVGEDGRQVVQCRGQLGPVRVWRAAARSR